jgi:hypothetical protein
LNFLAPNQLQLVRIFPSEAGQTAAQKRLFKTEAQTISFHGGTSTFFLKQGEKRFCAGGRAVRPELTGAF